MEWRTSCYCYYILGNLGLLCEFEYTLRFILSRNRKKFTRFRRPDTLADCATSPLSIQIDNSIKKSINWCWMNNVQVHSSVLSFTVSFTVLQQKKLRHQVPPGAWFTSLPTDGTVGSPSLPTLDVSVVVIGQCPGEWMRRSGTPTWVTSSFVDLSCVSFTCSPWPVVPLVHVIRCAISTSPLRGQQHPQRHFFDYNLAD